MTVKFSQIASGGAYVPATDTVMAVRGGTTDVLLSGVAAGPGVSVAGNLAAFPSTDGVTLEDSGVPIASVPLLAADNALTGQNTITSIQCAGTAPVVTLGAGNGTGGSDVLTGHDNAGTIQVTTGAAPSASAAIATVAFHKAFANGASVVLFPADAATAALIVSAAATTAHFIITAGAVPLTTLTTYKWNYQVVGY
jgi:hypothetical protein